MLAILCAALLGQSLEPVSVDGPIFANPALSSTRALTFLTGAPFALANQCAGTLPATLIGTVAVARASSAYCPKSDGTYVSSSSNVARVGRFGVLSELSATQLLTATRDLSNAAWVKTTMTCAKTATGADGVAASASTCTASGSNATVLQTFTAGSGQRAFSVSMKRRTGTGTVAVTTDNGVTWCDVTTATATAMAQGCQWIRLAQYGDDWHDTAAATCASGCGALTQTLVNPVVGVRLGTSGDAVDVDFAQLEASAYATTPMNGSSRAAETLTVTPSKDWPVASGYVEMKMTPLWAGNSFGPDLRTVFDGRTNAGTGDAQYLYMTPQNGINTYAVRNGSGASQSTATFPTNASAWVGDILFGAPRLYRIEWDSGRIRYRLNGVTQDTVTGVTNVPAAAPLAIRLGALYDGSSQVGGFISDLRVSSTVRDDTTAVVTVGDSVLRGAFDVYTSSAIQAALSARRTHVSPYAVSGATTVECTSQYTTSVAGTDADIVVDNCGINNLLGGGQDAATAWGNMQTLLNTIYAAGYNVVAVNITPCKGYATCSGTVQSNIVTVNASLASWVQSHGHAVLVDANALLRKPADHDSLDTRCSDESGADFLHPDNSCTVEYANAIAGALP